MEVRDTLLIACGTQDTRAHLQDIFRGNFNLLEAENTHQAKLLLEQNHRGICSFLLDVGDDRQCRNEMLEEINLILADYAIPTIVVTESDDPEQTLNAFNLGAMDVIPRSYVPYAFLRRVQNVVDLHRKRWNLEELVQAQAADLRHSHESMIDMLSSLIEYRSAESGQHILRVRRFTRTLLEEVARTCPEYNLTPEDITNISSAAALHDVGKISIPDAVLNKPGKLTPEEFEVMKTHSRIGRQLLEQLNDLGSQEYVQFAHNICHYHHERWDGRGYPEGLRGDAIPICAQVVGLADAYDALTSKRVYKDAYSLNKSMNMILNGECGAFSPQLLECFKAVVGQFESIATAYADGVSPRSEEFNAVLPGPVRQVTKDILESTQLKFTALLRHLDAMVIEADIDQGLFQIHYNADPNLAAFNKSAFDEAEEGLMEETILPQEAQRMGEFLHTGVVSFLDRGMRRHQEQFWVRSVSGGDPILYDVILLRLHTEKTTRRFLAIWQKAARQPEEKPRDRRRLVSPRERAGEDFGRLAGFLRYRNDNWFTLECAATELAALLGYTARELQEQFGGHLLELIPEEDRESVRQSFNEQLAKGRDVELSYRLTHKEGHVIWVLNKSRLIDDLDQGEYLYGLITDITQSREERERLESALHQYRALLTQRGNVLYSWDMVNDTFTVSPEWHGIFGYSPIHDRAVTKLGLESHVHPDDIPHFFQTIQSLKLGAGHQSMEVRIANREGQYLWCRFWSVATRDKAGRMIGAVGTITNIDEEKRAAQNLQEKADTDALTKLLNKQAARRQAEDYLGSLPDGTRCALILIDLDNFKQVNDRFGHMFGDAVLMQAAREIKKTFRSQDMVARIGGDEFMVLMRSVANRETVEERCDHLVNTFREVFQGEQFNCGVSCSVGVTLAPDHGETYYDLFQRADQAMYQAKDRGKDCYAIYDSQQTETFADRKNSTISQRIDSDIQPGLAGDSLVRYTFQRLYEAQDIESAVNDILAMVGKQLNVSRVYVFENNDDNTTCSNTFEWCNEGISPEIDNLQNVSYLTDIPGYEENFDEKGIFYCPDITTLPQEHYEVLEPQGIKAMLQCAILDKGVFRGYVGLDECEKNLLWTKEQIEALTFCAEILSIFLLKSRAQEKALRQADDLTAILDAQTSWCYVIDPDTCQLKFLNAKTRSLASEAREGMPCYQALQGREERCPGCPALGIRETGFRKTLMRNDIFDLTIQAEAARIQWRGKESCLLTCRELGRHG